MSGIFKAYDVRGLYPDQIDESTTRAIGLALQHVIERQGPWGRTVVVSRDMRPHSQSLSEALCSGLLAAGFDVVDIGLATTPMNYFAVGHLRAAGGVQVTASHNPAQYNGLKFSLHEARPVSGDHGIPLLERAVSSGHLPHADRPGQRSQSEIMPAYRSHVLSFLETPATGRRLRVVVDAANGMGCLYRDLLESSGIELVPLYFELDGTFPNHEANPLKPENLRDLCREVRRGADLGVSFDGDADRAAFVDEHGEPIGSDLITALIGGELLRSSPGGTVLYDIRSSRAVPEYIREHGGVPRRERVGHSFIKAALREVNGIFGGELAGHYYFRENFFADCALLAVFLVLNMVRRGDSLSRLVAPLRRYAKSPEINFVAADPPAMIERLAERYRDGEMDRLDGIRIDYADWWFNVRPSNTEPLLRLVLEARTPELLAARQNELVAILGDPV